VLRYSNIAESITSLSEWLLYYIDFIQSNSGIKEYTVTIKEMSFQQAFCSKEFEYLLGKIMKTEHCGAQLQSVKK